MNLLGTYYPEPFELVEVNCPECKTRLLLPAYVITFRCPVCFEECRLKLGNI